LSSTGDWKSASSIQVGDKLLTIGSEHIDLVGLSKDKKSSPLGGGISLVESEVVSVEVKTSTLIGFNNLEKGYSITQPILVKLEDGISYKNAGEVEAGDILLGATADGNITETVVESIQKDETESDVYDIRTSPQPWFITKSFIAIA
jgi:hypothetical protein